MASLWLDGVLAPELRVTGPARDLFLDMNGRFLPPWARAGTLRRPTIDWTG